MKTKLKYSKFKSFRQFFKTKKPNPSGLVLYFGNRGSGKSTFLAKYYYDNCKSQLYQNVHSNMALSSLKCDDGSILNANYLDLTNYTLNDYLDPEEPVFVKNRCLGSKIDEIPQESKIKRNSLVLIDELGIIHNNRDYKSFPKEFTRFIKIIRKVGILIIANSQNYDIDKSLRNGANQLFLVNKHLGIFSIARKIKKYIKVNQKQDDNADNQIYDAVEFENLLSKDSLQIINLANYSSLFNSFE